MTTYTGNCIEGKIQEDVLEVTAGERDSDSPYQSPELPNGNTKETSKRMSASECNEIKKLLEYIIKENKAF
jgi:hypothetical protein